jgi:phage terminase small subunit
MCELNNKQQAFVEEYLIDFNATQAAIRAGYSAKTAEKIGYQLLENTRVSTVLAEKIAERSRRTGITADRVLQEYARIAFAKMTDVAEWGPEGVKPKKSSDLSEDDAACVAAVTSVETTKTIGDIEIKTVTTTVKLHDKKSALDSLSKHLGITPDKLEVSGPGGKPISHDVTITIGGKSLNENDTPGD